MLFKLRRVEPRSHARRLPVAARKLSAALLLAVLLPAAASAYTVVMRSGRRIEIPSAFTVTATTLTYEAAPGINVTLMMTAIDISATERANNEPAGSLLRRAQLGPTSAAPTGEAAGSAAGQTRRTLTNKDLEASREARLRSEESYERRRKELGLPPLDEVRRRNAEEAERAREQLEQSERNTAESEEYWRGRANALRTEMAALDAEINYLRARLTEEPDYVAVPFTSVTTVLPSFGRPFPRPGPVRPILSPPILIGNPGFIHAAGSGLQVNASIGFGGGLTRSQLLLRAGVGSPIVAPPVIIGGTVFGRPLTAYSVGPLSGYYPSYEREVLLARLREMEAARAGLQARWRLLEDEARRAGALPGWLRP